MEVCNSTESLGTEIKAEKKHAPTLEYATAQAGERLVTGWSGHNVAQAAVLSSWVACDPKSLELLEHAKQLAESAATLLIRGESGTGKDLLAELVHYLGPHADEPLVKIDCASLPQALVDSELFGHERGAIPGATQSKRGRLEMAGRGTIVLDEVAALSMPTQAKLLRVIEEQRCQRLGGSRAIEVDARIVALTSIDLERAVSRRSFREDLYYRLNVTSMVVPPLRERVRDVKPLVQHLLRQLAEIHRKPQLAWSAEALAALERYSFPGNVRELRNVIEGTVIQGNASEITLDDLPAHVRGHGLNGHRKSLEDLEREYIAEILAYTRGKKSKAAAILGISRKTLLEKRKRYGLG